MGLIIDILLTSVIVFFVLLFLDLILTEGQSVKSAANDLLSPYIIVGNLLVSFILNYVSIYESPLHLGLIFRMVLLYSGSILFMYSWGGAFGFTFRKPEMGTPEIFAYFEKNRKPALRVFLISVAMIFTQFIIDKTLIVKFLSGSSS